MTAIQTIGLEYVYADGTNALSGVNFEAKKGEKVAVLGPNGSGKTTLFYHFNGLIKPARGVVKIFGENINDADIDKVRKRVGLVFQESDNQLFAPTVFEDIAFGPRNLRLSQQEVKERVDHVLHRFDIEQLAKRNPANLSGGQKKRVAIAGVVAMEPDVLVLDEPTSGMDAGGITDTIGILDELNNDGKTIIISTHDCDLAAGWADRIYILNRGKVFRSGIPRHIFSDEKLVSEAGLRQPVIVQTYREFRARGISKGEVPLSVLDLMESFDGARVMNVRCAISGCEIKAGDHVSLKVEDGMLVACKGEYGVTGIAMFDGNIGEDIAVKEVVGNIEQMTGKITVIRVPGVIEGGSRAVNLDKVRDILDKNKSKKIGAMGTSAKALMNKMGIKCDLEFDVIQSAMLAALRGLNVVVFASGGMAQRVMEKAKEKKVNCQCFVLADSNQG
ncbi:MAG: ATP-binding cassette domain-containing protein [Candidatus Methanoperedens sp.]|nr:ATP-binding cassette domain-containing protein [Candidatus Methanoperedens sp.]